MTCTGLLFLTTFQLSSFTQNIAGWDSEVGVASLRAGSPGMGSRKGARFFAFFQTGFGAHPALYTMSAGSFPWIKWPGRSVSHSPHLTQRLRKNISSSSACVPLCAFLAFSRVNF